MKEYISVQCSHISLLWSVLSQTYSSHCSYFTILLKRKLALWKQKYYACSNDLLLFWEQWEANKKSEVFSIYRWENVRTIKNISFKPVVKRLTRCVLLIPDWSWMLLHDCTVDAACVHYRNIYSWVNNVLCVCVRDSKHRRQELWGRVQRIPICCCQMEPRWQPIIAQGCGTHQLNADIIVHFTRTDFSQSYLDIFSPIPELFRISE